MYRETDKKLGLRENLCSSQIVVIPRAFRHCSHPFQLDEEPLAFPSTNFARSTG